MKKITLLTILCLCIVLAGCGQKTTSPKSSVNQNTNQSSPDTICELNNTVNCDRSCEKNQDCKPICGAGCININETFDPKNAEIDCAPPTGCECINNICRAK